MQRSSEELAGWKILASSKTITLVKTQMNDNQVTYHFPPIFLIISNKGLSHSKYVFENRKCNLV